MVYRNYFRYGDSEVANNVRTQQYVANGLKPTGVFIPPCDDCGDIALVTDGTEEYQTPELDEMEWVAGPDFDAPDFAGVYVRDVTGLEGSTTTVEVLEKIGDGGQIGTRRTASKTIAVTADLVGRTREATNIGLEWLTAQLHPPCSAGGDCSGETLHLFTTCPVSCVGLTDPDTLPITTQYDNAEEFQTTAIQAVPGPMTNYAEYPSGEVTGAWHSNTAFGAYVTGTVTSPVAPPVVLARPNAIRLSTPALAIGQKTNVTAAFTVGDAGVYEISVWVYVPAATTINVRACVLFGGGGPYSDVKDRWIRLTHRENLGAGASPFIAVDTEPVAAAKGAGMLIWTDAWSIKKVPGPADSANNQGSLSTSVDGWYGQSAFGNFTVPQAIECVAFPSPSPVPGQPDNPKSIRVTWKAAKDPGTIAHAVYVAINDVVPAQVYTVECDMYMTANSTEFEGDGLFNGKGAPFTTKGVWHHAKHTFTTPNTSINFGFTSMAGQDMGVGPNYMYLANLQVSPGFGTEPLNYFDGALQDATSTNLAAGIVATPVGDATITPDQTIDGVLWQRLNQGAGWSAARVTIPLASLTSGRRYVASWEVYNPHQTKSRDVTTDWVDAGTKTYTLAPLEKRRIYAIAKTVITAGSRHTDLEITPTVDNSEPVYFRDVQVRPDSLMDYAWTGTADTSDSTATPTGNDFIFKPDAGDSQLFGPLIPGVCDTFEVTWTVSSPTGAIVDAWASASTPDGDIIQVGEIVQVGDVPTDIVIEGVQTPGFPDDWRPVLTTTSPFGQGANGRQLTVHSLKVTHRAVLTLEECVTPYRRTLHNVVTVEGPKVLEWLTLGDMTDDSTVARVEWTWVATDPHMWHDPIPILNGVNGAVIDYRAPGVNVGPPVNAPVNSTACARPAATALTCADNALGPGIILPPQAPTIVDTSIMNLAGKNRTRVPFEIPVGLSPVGLGKLSWRFVNDNKPKFGIRVRIYEDADPAFNVSVPLTGSMLECNFVEEFTIEYLGANQILYIDGPGDDVYVDCGTDDAFGNPIYADARKNLRGNYGGPFKNSWIGCGKAYYVSVDTPNVYSATPSNLSGLGDNTAQGTVVWSVDLVRRA